MKALIRKIFCGRKGERYRAELQAMFDAMPDGVLVVDRDFRVIQSNPRASELLPRLKDASGRIPLGSGNGETCPFQGLRKVFIDGTVNEHQCSIRPAGGEERHLHSICAPIREDGWIVYAVAVVRDMTDRVNTERELEERTSELAAANKMLSRLAGTDGLTQLSNRRHFDEALYKEIKRFNRRKYSSLSVMLIDIDHFKQLNDRFGHLTGDAVLRELARLLMEGARETDTIARYGGEEFVLVMPDTHLDGAAYKAERLRRKVEETPFPGQNGPLRVTISAGVADYVSGPPQDLIHAADTALYEAKRAGRNTVAVKRPEGIEI